MLLCSPGGGGGWGTPIHYLYRYVLAQRGLDFEAPDLERGIHFRRVSMGWWLLRLSAKIWALLRLSVNFFQLRLTEKLKINFFCFKG